MTESMSFAAERIAAIGEAKGTTTAMDVPHLERLEHLRSLLPSAKVARLPTLLLFARSGFTAELGCVAGTRPDVELIDPTRMYNGA